MLKSDEIRLAQAARAKELAELAGAAEISAEQAARIEKLTAEHRSATSQLEAAIIAEAADREKVAADADGDAGDRERRELRNKASVSKYFQAVAGHRLDGPEQELNAELSLDRNQIPIELFEREKRTITAAPGTVGVNIGLTQPYIFAPSIGMMMGVDMPMVPSGTYAVPIITTALTAGARAKDTDQAATAAAFTVQSMTPKQVSARLELNISDIAAAGTNLESALRSNLSMALSAELDNQLINGDGTGNNLAGFFKQLTDASADATLLSFDHGLAKLSDLIDGLWATETTHIRQIVGVDTYKLAAKLTSIPATGGKGELTLADYLRMHSGGFSTNSRMPATASKKQKGLALRSGVSGLMTSVCAHWGSISIDDPYSNSAKGQKNLSIHVLVSDLQIVQAGAYSEVEYKVAA